MTISTSLPCAPIASATEHPPEGNRDRRRPTTSATPITAIPITAIPVTTIMVLLLAAASGPAHAQMNYKWEDAEGETIYVPIPPDDPEQPYCQRSNDGPWTCFEGADRLVRPPPDPDIMTPEQRRQREDQLLVTRFRSLEAIEQGREERQRQLSFERQAVLSNMEGQRRALFDQIRAAADRQRAGLAVPERQRQALEATRRNLADNAAVLARIDDQADVINREHEAMKDRYRQLLEAQTAP